MVHVFSCLFRCRFSQRFFHCFFMNIALILGAFWGTFSILFRHRFSDAFLDAKNLEKIATWRILVGFWAKIYNPEGIRNVTFSDFFWSPVSASNLERFWVGLGFIFEGFGMIFRPFLSYKPRLYNRTLAHLSTRDLNTNCHTFLIIFIYQIIIFMLACLRSLFEVSWSPS